MASASQNDLRFERDDHGGFEMGNGGDDEAAAAGGRVGEVVV